MEEGAPTLTWRLFSRFIRRLLERPRVLTMLSDSEELNQIDSTNQEERLSDADCGQDVAAAVAQPQAPDNPVPVPSELTR